MFKIGSYFFSLSVFPDKRSRLHDFSQGVFGFPGLCSVPYQQCPCMWTHVNTLLQNRYSSQAKVIASPPSPAPALHTGAHLHGVAGTLRLRPGLLIDYKMSVTGTSDHFRHGRGPRITSCRCKSTLLASGLWESCQSLPQGSIWLFHKAIGNIKYIAHPKPSWVSIPKALRGGTPDPAEH